MRSSTLLLVVITSLAGCLGGCLGEVGGSRKPGVGSGSDEPVTPMTTPPATGACAKVEKAVMIRVPADMELLPRTGCYDIVGKLTIQSSQITSLAGLAELASVSELELDYTGLTTLDARRTINLYGPLTVTNNPALRDLRQLHFATPPSSVVIDNNAALFTLDPFINDPQLTEVNGDVSITGNATLPLIGMPYLTRVAGALALTNNDLVGLIDLSRLATTRSIDIADNAQLTKLTGLAATEIAGDLAIRANPKLTSIGAMGALVRVSGNLTIDGNTALASLAAFTLSMKTIGQTLTINNNPALTDLGMLKHLDSINSIAITNNPALVVCRAIEVDGCVAHAVGSRIQNNRDGNCSSSCN